MRMTGTSLVRCALLSKRARLVCSRVASTRIRLVRIRSEMMPEHHAQERQDQQHRAQDQRLEVSAALAHRDQHGVADERHQPEHGEDRRDPAEDHVGLVHDVARGRSPRPT